MNRQTEATNTTLVVLRTVTGVIALCALLLGLVLSDAATAKTLLAVGIVFGLVAGGLALASGALHRLTLGGAIVVAVAIILVGTVLIDLVS